MEEEPWQKLHQQQPDQRWSFSCSTGSAAAPAPDGPAELGEL